MTGLKVHGYVYSTASMRVIAAIHEKDLDYELVPVDLVTNAQKQEPFISLNPLGQVPAFEDGDLTLFESRAITQYIAHTYASNGTPLIVADPKKMAIMTVWAEVEAHQFDPVASKLAWEIFIKPLRGMVTDEAVAEELEAKLAKVLDVYEARLSESKYLGGDEFTLADLHHLPVMHYLIGTRVKKLFDERPHVSAWSTVAMARPAWAKVVAMQSH